MEFKVLILSRDDNSAGGVVDFISALRNHYSTETNWDVIVIGRRSGSRSRIRRYIQVLIDAARLRAKVLSGKYDLVHINPSFNIPSLLRDGLFMLVLRMTGQKCLVFFHGWDESLSHKAARNVFFRNFIKFSFGWAGLTLVLAGEFKNQLARLGVPSDNIYTITTMFDGQGICSECRATAAPRYQILFLSRFVREKGLFELLDAFARIVKELPEVRLILAGDGPARADVEQAVHASGLSEYVELPGYIRGAKKTAVLAASDIFVLPTYYGEGCPVSLLEAMAAGLALVSTPVGGIPDVLKDGENGVLLPSADPELIYQALHRLLSSPQRLTRISNINREKAWRCYEASVVTAQIEEYYKQAAGLPT